MLEGRRVRLRPPRDTDLPVLRAIRNDVPLQRQLMAHPRPNDDARVREWLARRTADPDALFFVLADASTNDPVGFIQLLHIGNGEGELGIALASGQQGRGYGAEAVKLLEQHAAQSRGVRKVVLRVLEANQAAIRFYVRLGYRTVEFRKGDFHADDGTAHDVRLMEHALE